MTQYNLKGERAVHGEMVDKPIVFLWETLSGKDRLISH